MTEPVSAPRRKSLWLILLVAVCLAAGGGAYWYKNSSGAANQSQNGKNRPVPVVVVEAKSDDVEVYLSGLGTVSPQSSVTVKSRVDGQLMQVLVREGQAVKAGELLLVIDPRPFQVQLAQAEGQLKRDAAFLENARLDLKRYNDLVAQGAIARQQLDTQQSLVRQYEGAVASDKATADSARLQITYSRITSPFSGTVGLRQVDPGNMVHASDQTGLIVINQLSPINVLFTLTEDQLPRVLAKLRAGEKLRVDAFDRGQSQRLAQGELASVDNQIDPGTGTVRLKATFANSGGELYPNQFVNAKLLLEVLKDVIVVPPAAVQHGQQGTYVYVVTPEGVATSRPVTVGEATDDASVILSGLAAGEKVVLDGADRLRDGAQVEIKERGAKPGAKPESGPDAQNATAPAQDAKAADAAKPMMGKKSVEAAAKPADAAKLDNAPDTKPDTKPDNKPEHKAERKQKAKPETKSKTAPEQLAEPAPAPAPAVGTDGETGSQPKADK